MYKRQISGKVNIFGDAKVSGDIVLYSNINVSRDAKIARSRDIVWFSNIGTNCSTLSIYRSESGKLLASEGLTAYTTDEFLERSKKKHDSKIHREYELLIEASKLMINHKGRAHNNVQSRRE